MLVWGENVMQLYRFKRWETSSHRFQNSPLPCFGCVMRIIRFPRPGLSRGYLPSFQRELFQLGTCFQGARVRPPVRNVVNHNSNTTVLRTLLTVDHLPKDSLLRMLTCKRSRVLTKSVHRHSISTCGQRTAAFSSSHSTNACAGYKMHS